MASKTSDPIPKQTVHLGRICWPSFTHPRAHHLEERANQYCSYIDCDIDILGRGQGFENHQINTKVEKK